MSRKGEKRRLTDCKSASEQGEQRKRRSPRIISSSNGECNKDKQPASQTQKPELDHDKSGLPEKRILELVIDTLQRKDTYNIFSEPVDPSEVEEYYEIITEPMDFGTMRAKLHEGLYNNLQQFEDDMYLIFDNAMYFNPSGTVYFKQARALEDLAKKVFQSLKNDPHRFELEFTVRRGRSSRKLDSEPPDSTFCSGQKIARDLEPNNITTDVNKKGDRRRRQPFPPAIDRRCTYKPWKSMLDETNSTASAVNCDIKPLIQVDKENTGYRKSIMSFVKDLGPTAQRVAEQKLQGLWTQTTTNKKPNLSNYSNSSTSYPQILNSQYHLKIDLNDPLCHPMPITKSLYTHENIDVGMTKEAPDKGRSLNTLSSLNPIDANPSPNLEKCEKNDGTIVMGLLATRDKSRCTLAKESKHNRVGKFDLNKAQPIPNSSNVSNHIKEGGLMAQTTQFEPLAINKDSNVGGGPAGLYTQVQNMPPLFSRQLMFNVPYLEARLYGAGNTSVTTTLQLGSDICGPLSSKMSFELGSSSRGYTSRTGYLNINHAHWQSHR